MMAAPRSYVDYRVELRNYDSGSDQYEVALFPPQKLGEPAPVKAALALSDIQEPLRDLEAKALWVEDLIPLGKQLMDRLLPDGPLRDHLVNAVKNLSPEQGLRLRLQTSEPKLQQLPWEYAYLKIHEGPENRNHFLVLDPRFSLVRHVPLDQPLPDLQPADPHNLHMLAVFASPVSNDFKTLRLKTESRVLEHALGDFNVEGVSIDWKPFLEDATLDDLDNALLQKPSLFHFSGHGQFKERDDQGSLVLLKDKQDQAPDFLPADDLARKLRAAGVRLAVLGACESSRIQGKTPWTSIAPALVVAGVGAVIAMQYEVVDAKAILFDQAFYRSLAAGLTVDEGVSLGRQAVLAKSDGEGVEWGVPTLYMRADGVLFPKLVARDTNLGGQLRKAIVQTIDTIDGGSEAIGIEIKGGSMPGSFEVIQKVGTLKDHSKLVGFSGGSWPPQNDPPNSDD
jgi:CHAT domain